MMPKNQNNSLSVEIVAYNPDWSQQFEIEAEHIKAALGGNCVAIHHIGSTAIPGLSAKPLLDIMPVVKDILAVDSTIPRMEKLGYQAKGEYGIAFRRFFQKGDPMRTHNVHVYEENSPEIEHTLLFREYLKSHSEARIAYATLKQALAMAHPNDINRYWLGKEAFIQDINNKTGFQGYRMMQAFTPKEWEVYRRIHLAHNLEPAEATKDLNHLNLKDKQDYHFIFMKGTQIIGVAWLQVVDDKCLILKMLLMDTLQDIHERSFFVYLDKWSRQQGRTMTMDE